MIVKCVRCGEDVASSGQFPTYHAECHAARLKEWAEAHPTT